jgi:hypothetical protein
MQEIVIGEAMKTLLTILILVSSMSSQVVIEPWQIPCREELVKPNLEVVVRQRITGVLKDATGAAFEKSVVILRKQNSDGKLVDYRTVVTDTNGEFDLKIGEPGQYRFLPAPNRGWKQPARFTCGGTLNCQIKLTLEVNPTDQPFAGCPIR